MRALLSDSPLGPLAQILPRNERLSLFALLSVPHDLLYLEAIYRINRLDDVSGGKALVVMQEVGVVPDHVLIGGAVAQILPRAKTLVSQRSIICFSISNFISSRQLVLPRAPSPYLTLTLHRAHFPFLLASQVDDLIRIKLGTLFIRRVFLLILHFDSFGALRLDRVSFQGLR